ncbi:HET-domain-containing protein, partial [Zopfia rhizophila CBS 207.26]
GDYIALSYCWGSGENLPLRNILINGRFLQVTESLEAALRFYRTLESSETKVLLWADAICINQSDSEEKRREIIRMREVYAGATGVLVHLGHEDDDSNRGIDVVQRTATDVAVDQGSSRRLEHLQNRENPCASVRRDVVALLNILSRPYWRRLWILQEIAMADGSLILGYGDRRIRLTDFLLAAKFLWHNLESILLISGDVWKYLMLAHGSLWVLLFFDKLQDIQRRSDQPKGITFSGLQMPLLNLGQNALSREAHDKVFGLLGILPKEIGSKMEQYVNYEIPTNQLFVTFTKAIIEYT